MAQDIPEDPRSAHKARPENYGDNSTKIVRH